MSKRSNAQSKYRWAVVVPMLREHWRQEGFNYTADQVNTMMKLGTNCYVEVLRTPWNEITRREMSTSTSTPKMFEDWMEAVRDWAYDKFDLDIPPPNEIPVNYYEQG